MHATNSTVTAFAASRYTDQSKPSQSMSKSKSRLSPLCEAHFDTVSSIEHSDDSVWHNA